MEHGSASQESNQNRGAQAPLLRLLQYDSLHSSKAVVNIGRATAMRKP